MKLVTIQEIEVRAEIQKRCRLTSILKFCSIPARVDVPGLE